jgi:hypothetical protein
MTVMPCWGVIMSAFTLTHPRFYFVSENAPTRPA